MKQSILKLVYMGWHSTGFSASASTNQDLDYPGTHEGSTKSISAMHNTQCKKQQRLRYFLGQNLSSAGQRIFLAVLKELASSGAHYDEKTSNSL